MFYHLQCIQLKLRCSTGESSILYVLSPTVYTAVLAGEIIWPVVRRSSLAVETDSSVCEGVN